MRAGLWVVSVVIWTPVHSNKQTKINTSGLLDNLRFVALDKCRCDCNDTGYDGEFCQDDIDECAIDQPCKNGGICTNTLGSFECDCDGTEYGGKNCKLKSKSKKWDTFRNLPLVKHPQLMFFSHETW